ncbi:MAG: hypothetical protein WDM81_14615 [Rhizomicrobium sp.]
MAATGVTTFALPDLQGRVPMHRSNDGQYPMGLKTGFESVTLTINTMPAHFHSLLATNMAGDKIGAHGACLGPKLGRDGLLLRPGHFDDGDEPELRVDGRGQSGASEHGALSGGRVLHRRSGRVPQSQLSPAGFGFPEKTIERATGCRIIFSAKFACSAGPSPPGRGRFATASS